LPLPMMQQVRDTYKNVIARETALRARETERPGQMRR